MFYCLATAHQTSCAQVSFWVRRSKIPTRSNDFYTPLYLTYFAFGRMASEFQQSQDQKVRCTWPCGRGVLTLIGWLVCIILITVVCDKPTVHKMGGFVSHSHTNFCSLCWISVQDKAKPSAFQDGGALLLFLAPLHTLTQHSILSSNEQGTLLTWWNISTTYHPPTWKNFVKEYATQYCKLSRLLYFNLVKQIVVNPMYNLFLSQFYSPTVFFHADSG